MATEHSKRPSATKRGPATLGAYLSVHGIHKPHELDALSDAELASSLSFFSFDATKGGDFLRIGTATVVVEMDGREEFARNAVATLRDKQKKVRAEAQAEVTRIDQAIQSLLALEHAQ